jgi:hypothetical protein
MDLLRPIRNTSPNLGETPHTKDIVVIEPALRSGTTTASLDDVTTISR